MGEKRTLTEIARLVGIDIKTLRRWIRIKGIDLSIDPHDRRCRTLSDTDVDKLIQERLNDNKSVRPISDEYSDTPTQNIKKLSKEISLLRSDIKYLKQDLDTFSEEFSKLQDVERRTFSQLTQLSQKISSFENFLEKLKNT
jgi:DNA-binding transcriptional MerR regulator